MIEPAVPSECNLTDFAFMPLEVQRLRKSKAWLLARRKPEIGFYMINLWSAAWHNVPAGSLEDDDDVLADQAMCDPKRWPKVREEALRGWVKATDGRLYHNVLTEKVLEAWDAKKKQRARTAAATEAKKAKKQRNDERNVPRHEQRNGERDDVRNDQRNGDRNDNATSTKGQGQGQGERNNPETQHPASARAVVFQQVWKALNVNDASGLPPNLSHRIGDAIDALLAENCDLQSDVLPALAARPEGQGWPQSPAFWIAIARSKRDKRVASAATRPPPLIERGQWLKWLRVWREERMWDRRMSPEGWGPAPGELGCLVPAELLEPDDFKARERAVA